MKLPKIIVPVSVGPMELNLVTGALTITFGGTTVVLRDPRPAVAAMKELLDKHPDANPPWHDHERAEGRPE